MYEKKGARKRAFHSGIVTAKVTGRCGSQKSFGARGNEGGGMRGHGNAFLVSSALITDRVRQVKVILGWALSFFAFSHLALTALRADSLRCSGVITLALAGPPFLPPFFPKRVSCGKGGYLHNFRQYYHRCHGETDCSTCRKIESCKNHYHCQARTNK